MAPGDEEKTEPNNFRHTLVSSKTLVANCGDTVYSGYGSPLDSIATPLGDGGWSCSEADEWITEMTGQCAGITEAFDDAVTTIQQRISSEPDRVPEGDYRGNSWNRSWAQRHNY